MREALQSNFKKKKKIERTPEKEKNKKMIHPEILPTYVSTVAASGP